MTTEPIASSPPPAAYPVRLEIERPESQSRLTNLPLFIGLIIRFFLVIPHLLILSAFSLLAGLLYFIATFGILFTRSYPRGMYDLVVSYMRWNANMNAYLSSLYDKYPPFNTEAASGYPLLFEVDYPEQSSRLLNFPLFGLLIRYILLIPHFIVLFFLGLVSYIVIFIARFAILFSGSFPAGLHTFVVGVTRWNTRISAYTYGLTDRYPPFSLD